MTDKAIIYLADAILEAAKIISNRAEEKSIEDNKDAILSMSASDFVKKHAVNTRIFNTVTAYANGWTVKDVYNRGNKLRNFGNKSLIDFREIVDEMIH